MLSSRLAQLYELAPLTAPALPQPGGRRNYNARKIKGHERMATPMEIKMNPTPRMALASPMPVRMHARADVLLTRFPSHRARKTARCIHCVDVI